MTEARGFIIAAWDERRSRGAGRAGQRRPSRVFLTGRLEDGRSFAAILDPPYPAVFVPQAEGGRALEALTAALGPGPSLSELPWSDMAGAPLARLDLPPLPTGGGSARAERAIAAAGIQVAAVERLRADEVLAGRGVFGPVLLRGEGRPGRKVDLVFVDPVLEPLGPGDSASLRWVAVDIETARDGRVVAVSMAEAGRPGSVYFLDESGGPGPSAADVARAKGPAPWGAEDPPLVRSFGDEASLLAAFASALSECDPDVVTGWNVVDFDFRVLVERYAKHSIPFDVGRTDSPAAFVEGKGGRPALDLPGRAVIDAMRLARGSGARFEELSLEAVARAVLGEGKSVASRGEDKLDELDRLRRDESAAFCAYCLRDSELVLAVLGATGLGSLTVKRAALTGVSLDLAWTSIPVFERVYAAALRARRILPPAREERRVSGAAGGTVLDPSTGIFPQVLVLDFRSLYPSIMRTFNVDPLAYARAAARPPREGDLVAPNGARFVRERGIMPELIERYAAERERALAAGDEAAAYVFKILQNSFYGVLGSEGCRYARTELAGAITSFGKKFLFAARDFFEARGKRVLYGDTDSVFVLSGLGEEAGYGELMALGSSMAEELNAEIAGGVLAEYGLPSLLRIRCEKAYRRFFIPRLRLDPLASEGGPARGRAKGYAGHLLLPDGRAEVEVRGMEAVRSDFTPLARRFQVELLARVFSGADEAALRAYCEGIAAALRAGELDSELVYRKSLRRKVEEYASETPQVRAAKLLGWTGRRGRVSFVMTSAGAEPVERRSGARLDYGHYVERQLLPIARAVAEAVASSGHGGPSSGSADAQSWFADRPQMELDFR